MKSFISQLIRVNHAGEFGAKRIYEGQMQYLKCHKDLRVVYNMYKQELRHLDFFNNQLIKRGIRPTLLMPLWNKLAFMLGAITAKIGSKAVMVCTAAIEEVIEEHYQIQINELKKIPKEKKLLKQIKKIQREEIEHKEIAINNDCINSHGYAILSTCIKKASKYAIWLSKKL